MDRCTFGPGVATAVTHFGGFRVEDSNVHCSQFLSRAGEGTAPFGDEQHVDVKRTVFDGCKSILDGGVEFGRYRFEDMEAGGINDALAILFQLSDPWGESCSV